MKKGATHGKRAGGAERFEAGKPTRKQSPSVDRETRAIGKQQGTTQRGFTSDARGTPRGPTRESRGRA